MRRIVELRGRVVVVTGASSGIGEATAVAFAQRGAKVVLAARRRDRLEDLADRIERAGGRALALACDVTHREEVERLPAIVREALGPTDVLINNAGVPGGGDFVDLSPEQIEKVVRVNLLGVMWGTHAFLPGMLARGQGHVVNVASLAGRYAPPGAAVYAGTKFGVVGFSEALHFETEPRGVLVTAVNPGFVQTEGFPQRGAGSLTVLKMPTVTDAIVRVVRRGIAPEATVPRWAAPFQTFRVLTPPLYRWGMRQVRRIGVADADG
ncbi:MAG: SDR family NAD(P)-dependent oxidoreductase [Planctomycetaceae bacterium]